MTHSIRVQTGARDAVSREAVRQLVRDVHQAIAVRGRCVMAIPGGSVAAAVLPMLRAANLPWSLVHLFWVDERVVPLSSDESNAAQALSLIADSHMATDCRLHPMTDAFAHLSAAPDSLGAAALRDAAAAYARTLADVAGTPPILDVALLGVGDDGHVASLFPGHQSVHATPDTVVVEPHAPKPPAVRLSLSAEVLMRARHVMVVAFGRAKAAAIRAALEDHESSSESPLAHIVRRAAHITVLVDVDAASALTSTLQEPIA